MIRDAASRSSNKEEPSITIGTTIFALCNARMISIPFIFLRYILITQISYDPIRIARKASSPSITVSMLLFSSCAEIISQRLFLMSAESSASKIFSIIFITLSDDAFSPSQKYIGQLLPDPYRSYDGTEHDENIYPFLQYVPRIQFGN